MDAIKENWTTVKEAVRREYSLSDISYHTWVEPLEFHNVVNDVVSIIIPSDQAHALNYISSKYKSFFQVTITEMFDHPYDINFILEKDVKAEEPAENEMAVPNQIYGINYEDAHLNPKYKFDTFVVGSNNKFAHSASLAVAESPGEVYNPLYLYGGPGLGKTHLMHSIGHFILEQDPDKKVLYVTSEEFTNEVIESIRSGNAASMTKLREKYRNVDVLMVDDVQFIIGKESTQEEFFHTFNALHAAHKQIILSSDKPPKEMETLDERFRSRFEWGLIADIQPPDYETRMAILRKNAETYDRQIDEEIIKYVTTANVACGWHAGDPMVMDKVVRMAKERGVMVGAHPGYPDLLGFGRRKMVLSHDEVKNYVRYQIGALAAFTKSYGMKLQHVAPHGAMGRGMPASMTRIFPQRSVRQSASMTKI